MAHLITAFRPPGVPRPTGPSASRPPRLNVGIATKQILANIDKAERKKTGGGERAEKGGERGDVLPKSPLDYKQQLVSGVCA